MIHAFDVNIAIEVGVAAATIYNYIEFRCVDNKNNERDFYDSTYWVRCKLEYLHKTFPYLSIDQIRYALAKLEESGYILTGLYNESKLDRSKWYTLTPAKWENSRLANEKPKIANVTYNNKNNVSILANSNNNSCRDESSLSSDKESSSLHSLWRDELVNNDEQLIRHTTTLSMSPTVIPTQQNQSTDGTVEDSDTYVEKSDGEIKVSLSPQAQEIYDLWREIGPIKPRVPSEAIVKACKAALGKFSIKDITEAITHYVEAYNDPKYFFKYKWDLPTFLKQRNCIPNFMEGGVAWENYKAQVEKRESKQAPQKVFVEFEQDNKQESKYE